MARDRNRSTAQEQPRSSENAFTGLEDDHIARRAYEGYEERGREDGGDLDDWYEAERELGQRRQEGAPGTAPGGTDDGVE